MRFDMRKILVTGGTIFVSRYIAEYFAGKGDAVYVLNRNHPRRNRISFYPKDDNVTLEMQVSLAKDIVKKFADHEIFAEIIAEFEHLL